MNSRLRGQGEEGGTRGASGRNTERDSDESMADSLTVGPYACLCVCVCSCVHVCVCVHMCLLMRDFVCG